jgi:hypothetical protein
MVHLWEREILLYLYAVVTMDRLLQCIRYDNAAGWLYVAML